MPPRLDLLPLVTCAPPIAAAGTSTGPVADLRRLNTGVAPTPQAPRKRMGLPAGPPFSNYPNNRIGDGVNANEVTYQETFPYVQFANNGRDGRHQNTGTSGCIDPVSFLPVLCP